MFSLLSTWFPSRCLTDFRAPASDAAASAAAAEATAAAVAPPTKGGLGVTREKEEEEEKGSVFRPRGVARE